MMGLSGGEVTYVDHLYMYIRLVVLI